jgi:hypothetical protein
MNPSGKGNKSAASSATASTPTAPAPSTTGQSPIERFFKIASDTLRAALLKQYGDDYTAAKLKTELELNLTNIVPMFSALDSPYVLIPPDVDTAKGIIAQAVNIWNTWDADGRPQIQ